MIQENPQLEQKTSGEIFEDVFNDNSLDNKNKLWTSNKSLINLIISLEYHSKEFIIQTLLGRIK
jgi:hypothetical protein